MKRILLVLFAAALMLIACAPTSGDTNGNEQLYGSEWVSDTGEGLRFFKDDSVQFFSTLAEGHGSFSYDSGSNVITFLGLCADFPSFTTEMPYAKIKADGTMELYWHIVGESSYNIEILTRRK